MNSYVFPIITVSYYTVTCSAQQCLYLENVLFNNGKGKKGERWRWEEKGEEKSEKKKRTKRKRKLRLETGNPQPSTVESHYMAISAVAAQGAALCLHE